MKFLVSERNGQFLVVSEHGPVQGTFPTDEAAQAHATYLNAEYERISAIL